MKYIGLLLALAFLLTALIYTPNLIYAQDDSPVPPPVPTEEPAPPDAPPDLPGELPDTATDVLPFIEEWLLFVSGLIATHIMAGVKFIPWFGKQKWFVKLATELVSGVTASVLAFLLGTAFVALGFLDESGLWQVILFAWPMAVGIYHGKKFSKAKAVAS